MTNFYWRLLMHSGLWIVLFSTALFNTLQAQEVVKDTLTNRDRTIETVTVTARRMPAKISSVVPIQSFSKEHMHDLGIEHMADAVRRFAGADVKDYGGIGGLKTVSLRNMGAAHTAVSYDGVTVSNCQAGQIDIGRFSLDNISMLTLSVGQADDMLQTARHYASAGVLSIETERPLLEDPRKDAFRVQLKGGSFGWVTPSVRWWHQLAARTQLSVDGTYMRADGNYPFTLVNGREVTKEKRNNSDIYTWQTEVNLFHTFRDESELNAKAYYYYSKRGLPGSVTLYNPISRERLWDENVFTQVSYKKRFSKEWAFRAQGKYNYSWNRYEDTNVKYEGGQQIDIHRQNEYYTSATVQWTPWHIFSLALAQDLAINTLRNNINNSPNPFRFTSQTALNARLHWQNLTLQGTLLNTFVTEEVDAGECPDDRKRLSPSLSLSYQPWKNEMLFLRVMYKSTFRVPTFNDLYYLRMGNTALRPEKAKELNLGITWSGAPVPFIKNITCTVDGYFNKVTDKIVAFPSTYVWRMANYGKAKIYGLDATLATEFPLAKGFDLMLSGAYTYQKAMDVTDPNSKTYKDQLPYTPLHAGNVAAVVSTPWLQVAYTVVGASKRYYMSQNIPQNEIDGYLEHSLTCSRSFSFSKSCKLQLRFECLNLTNKQYDIIKYYPMPGRSWRVTGVFDF